MQNDFWIMRPFNTLFIVVFAAFLALLVVTSLALRGKSDGTKRAVLVAACLVTFVGFFFYKYFISIDTDYDLITANMGGFNWWGELPLHLCNINMMLIPIAVLRRSRPIGSDTAEATRNATGMDTLYHGISKPRCPARSDSPT